MKLPRDLSGEELASLLCSKWGYVKVHQVGSHIILQTENPDQHRIAIPAHKALRIGTLNSILKAIANAKGVERSEILARLA